MHLALGLKKKLVMSWELQVAYVTGHLALCRRMLRDKTREVSRGQIMKRNLDFILKAMVGF